MKFSNEYRSLSMLWVEHIVRRSRCQLGFLINIVTIMGAVLIAVGVLGFARQRLLGLQLTVTHNLIQ